MTQVTECSSVKQWKQSAQSLSAKSIHLSRKMFSRSKKTAMLKTISVSAALIALTACTTMSAVQPIGDGRFMVGTSVRGGLSSDTEVKAGALDRARSFCAGEGKKMTLLSSSSSGTQGWTPQNAEVIFKCE